MRVIHFPGWHAHDFDRHSRVCGASISEKNGFMAQCDQNYVLNNFSVGYSI